jgi:sugar/nucleoside kinase (ribokinase family)
MDCWIEGHLDDLKDLLRRVDALIINEEEATLLAAENNLIKAADAVLQMGPAVVIIKKGKSGSLLCKGSDGKFLLPAFPAAEVKDPTGAGDSFAGGLMGYLAQNEKTDFDSLKTAVAYGTVVASFAIADFSMAGLTSTSKADIDTRFETLRKLTRF